MNLILTQYVVYKIPKQLKKQKEKTLKKIRDLEQHSCSVFDMCPICFSKHRESSVFYVHFHGF